MEQETRKRLIESVTKDIVRAGWRIVSTHSSRKKSTYIRCRKDLLRLTVRISGHPPIKPVGCSIHPGGHTREDLRQILKRAKARPSHYFVEWLNAK